MGNWATEVIARLAATQHGVIARWQLLEAGLGRGLITNRIARGYLLPLPAYHGVYAVGHRALSRHSLLMAATLSCRAALSHASAVELWGLRGRSGPIELTRKTKGIVTPGLVVHRSRTLSARDQVIHNRIPVTSVPRTLADISTRLDTKQLERAVNAAERQKLLDWREMDELLERRFYGTVPLREVLGRADPRATEVCEGLEELFLELWTVPTRPDPTPQALVEGYRVDFLWALAKVIVECDSYRYHQGRLKHDEDRIRDMRLEGAGYKVHRASHEILTKHADEFIETVHNSIFSRTKLRSGR